MIFEDYVKLDIERKYYHMLEGNPILPFKQNLVILSQNSYKARRSEYIKRLHLEKDEYNSVLEKTQEHRAIRLAYEERERKNREEQEQRELEENRIKEEEKLEQKAYVLWRLKQIIKMIIFFIPVILCIIMLYDNILCNVFCILLMIVFLILTILMYKFERFINRRCIRNKIKFDIIAAMIPLICFLIIILNVVIQ